MEEDSTLECDSSAEVQLYFLKGKYGKKPGAG